MRTLELATLALLATAGQKTEAQIPYQPEFMGQTISVPASTYGHILSRWWENPDSTEAVFRNQDLKLVRGPLIFRAEAFGRDWFQWKCVNCEAFWDAPLILRARKNKKA